MLKTNKIEKARRTYVAPTLQLEQVYIEYSIAANSAAVTPINASSQVREEWETNPDVQGSQIW